MDMQPLDILKWLGLTLAAGFIGYFGRYPAKLLIEKIWGRKKPSAEVASGKEVERSRDSLSKSHLKAEKKMAKQAAKSAKKAGRQ